MTVDNAISLWSSNLDLVAGSIGGQVTAVQRIINDERGLAIWNSRYSEVRITCVFSATSTSTKMWAVG